MFICLLACLGLVQSSLAIQIDDTKVIQLQMLFRHGERTPVMSYPTDIYNESTWDKYGGYGQLTQAGMRRHNHFGKYLRERYATFLNIYYNRNDVNIISSDVDRTLMSAYSMLSGLYKPVDYQVWDETISWQPIAVHTNNKYYDHIFYQEKCSKYNELLKEVENSEEFLQINDHFKDIFEVLNQKSGYTNMNLVDLWKIGDTLFIEKSNNLTLPDWAEPIYDRLVKSLGFGFYFNYRTEKMARLFSGSILNQMKINFEEKVKGSRAQLYLFSGHDTFVAALTKLLNLTEFINQPPYASAVLLELRESKNSEYFVQAYLKNNTGNEPILMRPMTIYGCDELCPYQQFMKIIENKVVTDIVKECRTTREMVNDNILAFIFCSLILTVVSISILISFLTFRKYSSHTYATLESINGERDNLIS